MADVKTGQCLCGAVRYTLESSSKDLRVCHCQMCRRFSGGIELAFDAKEDQVTFSGAEGITVFASSDWAERGFCSFCGSGLFWRMKDGSMFSLSAGTLDDFADLSLTEEIFIDTKPAGYAFSGNTKKMTEAEVIAAFAPSEEGEPQ